MLIKVMILRKSFLPCLSLLRNLHTRREQAIAILFLLPLEFTVMLLKLYRELHRKLRVLHSQEFL